MIYDLVFTGSAVRPACKKRRCNPLRNVHGRNYRGAFSLLYTCRQVNYEAPEVSVNNLIIDLRTFRYVDHAVVPIGHGKSEAVQVIRMSGREVNEITKWFAEGARNSNGDSYHYAMHLFPALLKIEVGDRKRRLRYDQTTVSNAMRFCFDNQHVEVCIL
jgi:hypothetical protein